MIHFEHNHKAKVKGPFAKTTQNFGNIDSEMLRKLESATIIIDARDTSRRIFNKKQEFEDRKVRLRSTSFYKPAADITYEAYMTKSTTQRLYYVASIGKFQTREAAKFANPLVPPVTISDILCDGMHNGLLNEEEWNHLILNDDNFTISYCKQFKVDATAQGKPSFSLTCCTRNRETSGEDSRVYRRFDWVSDTHGTFFECKHTFFIMKDTLFLKSF